MALNKSKALKAVLYARVSTEEQASRDNSIPAQIKAIKHFALNNNVEIISEYLDEGKSARTADRPQFQQMIRDAKKKDKAFSIIFVHKTDRFARNRADSVIYKSLLQRECGVDVISITENFDDSPTGKLLEGMMEVIAEFHSLNLAQEVMKGMKQKASEGIYVGRTPFGYSLNQTTKKLEINKDEAKTVKKIYELYAKGNSFASIKQTLNLAQILTRESKLWDSSALGRILKNPVYIGQYTWNKTKRSTNSQKNPNEWITIEDAHKAIIEQNLFAKVQQVLNSKRTMKGPSVKSPYLLSSIIKCGHCGHNMIGEKKKHISGKTYIRYVCGNYLNHKMCFYNFVHKEAIENIVFENIRNIIKTGKVDSSQVVVTQSDTSKSEIALLESQLKKVKQKFQKQLEAFEAEIISLEELQQAKERVLLEEVEMQEQLKNLKKKQSRENLGIDVKTHFDSMDEIIKENDPKIIKLWLKERIYRIEVFNKSDIEIQYRLPW